MKRERCGAVVWAMRLHPEFVTPAPLFALGRKNWLFAGSEPAGKRAAAIMSLIATAKANGHDPHAWLSDVLERLPTTLDRDINSLLPQNWKARG